MAVPLAIHVPRASPATRAADARESLLGRSFDSAADIAVCDDGRVRGLVPIERLLAASDDVTMERLMTPAVSVDAGDDEELVAAAVVRGDGRSAVVTDAAGRLVGLVPARGAAGVLWHEHEEDLARIGGFLARSSQARRATVEGIPRRLWHRLPWLGLGLLGAMLSAGIVASFEDELKRQVLLAFFIPAVVYMADAVGTQTEAVIIRGIAVGVPIRSVAVRETITGLVVGALIASAFFPFSLAVWGDVRIAATVAIALFASTATATVVAMALPYLLNRLGRDPAFGSGPLATVIQDLLSILIYFAVAVALTS